MLACAGSRSRQGRSRAPFDLADRTSAATHPVGFFNRPFGLPDRRASPASGGSTVCPDTLFSAPRPYLPRRKSNAGGMECEKCGLGRALFTTRSALLIPHHSQLTLVAIRHS